MGGERRRYDGNKKERKKKEKVRLERASVRRG